MKATAKRPDTQITYVRLETDDARRLSELAQMDDRTVAHLVRTAVKQYLNRRKAALEE